MRKPLALSPDGGKASRLLFSSWVSFQASIEAMRRSAARTCRKISELLAEEKEAGAQRLVEMLRDPQRIVADWGLPEHDAMTLIVNLSLHGISPDTPPALAYERCREFLLAVQPNVEAEAAAEAAAEAEAHRLFVLMEAAAESAAQASGAQS
jgi:hypothetical protein